MVAMLENGYRGGAVIRDHRKQRVREGRRDGLTRISAQWLLGVGCNLNPNSKHTVNSFHHLRTDQERSSGNPRLHILYDKSVCHEFSRCGLPFLLPSLSLVLIS